MIKPRKHASVFKNGFLPLAPITVLINAETSRSCTGAFSVFFYLNILLPIVQISYIDIAFNTTEQLYV